MWALYECKICICVGDVATNDRMHVQNRSKYTCVQSKDIVTEEPASTCSCCHRLEEITRSISYEPCWDEKCSSSLYRLLITKCNVRFLVIYDCLAWYCFPQFLLSSMIKVVYVYIIISYDIIHVDQS